MWVEAGPSAQIKELAALISVEPITKWNAPLMFDRTEPASVAENVDIIYSNQVRDWRAVERKIVGRLLLNWEPNPGPQGSCHGRLAAPLGHDRSIPPDLIETHSTGRGPGMETRDRFSRGAYIFNYRRHLVDTLRMLSTHFHTSDTFFPIALILTVFGSRNARSFQSRVRAHGQSRSFSGPRLD